MTHAYLCLILLPLGLVAFAQLLVESGPQWEEDWGYESLGEWRPSDGLRRGRRLRVASSSDETVVTPNTGDTE